MQTRLFAGLCLTLILVPLPAWSQGLSQFGGVQAGAAGLGAGLAASQNNHAFLRNSYKAAGQVQQAVAAQSQAARYAAAWQVHQVLQAENRAVQQYLAQGNGFEAKKQWDKAEKAFTFALQVLCKRDGPDSPSSVPALKHLVAVSKSQNKLDRAIGFQKKVVAIAHAAPSPDKKSLLGAERDLSDMFVQKGDYASAEPVLHDAVALMNKVPTVTWAQHVAALKVYGKVLRELNKTSEADAIDATLATTFKPVDASATVSAVAQPMAAATATGIPSAVSVIVPAPPTSSGNAAPTALVPAPIGNATSTISTESTISTASTTTNQKSGEKGSLFDAGEKAPTIVDEKPGQSASAQVPPEKLTIQSQTSGQDRKQADTSN